MSRRTTFGYTPGNRNDFVQQQSGSQVEAFINSIPFLNGRLIESVTITTANFDLEHGLGRPYRGYFVTRAYSQEFTLAEATPQPDTSRYIRLAASSNSNGDIWVF